LIVDNEKGAGVHRPSKMAGTLDGGQMDGHENRQSLSIALPIYPIGNPVV
jgi:hypothetical protein